MSMLARFVQITPDLLAELMENPDRVADLFKEEMSPTRGWNRLTDPTRLEAIRRAPQVFADSLAGLDPRIRTMLDDRLKRLGSSVEELQSAKGADVLAQIMSRARGILAPSQAPAGPALMGKGADISLEKAWHGVHYLLCGEAESSSNVLGQAVMGGTEIGEDESGYGPARVLSVREVADIAREMSRAGLETEMKARFDPGLMNGVSIYPGGWDTAGALDWLLEEFHHLRDFYADASARRCAIVTCIV